MKRLSFFIAFLFLATAIQAQLTNDNRDIRRRGPSLSFGVTVAEPTGQFGANFDGTPVGISAQFLSNFGRSPFEAGVGFNWMSRGTQSEDVWVDIGEDIDGDMIYEQATMEINSNMYTYTGVARFKPFAGRIQPYGDLVAGVRHFSTITKISTEDETNEPVKDRYNDDLTVVYGWAAGLKVRVAQGILVEGRFSKLQGGEVEFVDRETIEVAEDGYITFDRIASRTDLTSIQLGISFEF